MRGRADSDFRRRAGGQEVPAVGGGAEETGKEERDEGQGVPPGVVCFDGGRAVLFHAVAADDVHFLFAPGVELTGRGFEAGKGEDAAEMNFRGGAKVLVADVEGGRVVRQAPENGVAAAAVMAHLAEHGAAGAVG